MRFFTILAVFLSLAPSLFSQSNYFSVKFPDDHTYIGCNASVPVDAPVITQYGCNINVGVSQFDQKFNTNDAGTCFKILRRWRLLYWCDYNANILPTYINNPTNTDVGPTAVGNAANHGYLEYIQVIKVYDTDPPVFSNCPTSKVLFCDYTNNNTSLYSYPPHYDYCEGPVDLQTDVSDVCSGLDLTLGYRLWLDLDSNGSMETYVNSSDATAWPVELTTVNDKLHGKILFPAGFQLPYGTHKIEWVAGDHCGNEAVCKYEFEVRDCKNPTIVCINGLSVNLMQSGMITLWASDFLQYATDNCTPSNLIKIAIRKAGTGTGFPAGSTGVTFDCNETGTQLVEIWGQDQHGNADYCQNYVNVQDNMGICAPSASVMNKVQKTGGTPMVGATVTAKTANQTVAASAVTNASGQAGPMALIPGCYTITPSMNTAGAPTGISTLDALLLDLNIHAIEIFDKPWQFAASDVNGDGILTTEDVSAIIQTSIGVAQQWPGVANWQFIPSDASMPGSTIEFPETQQICLTANGAGQSEWIAVKSGDLDGSGDGNQFTGGDPEDRAERLRQIKFTIYDQQFEAGETVEVPVITPELIGLAGFQIALAYDPSALTMLAATPGLVPAQQLKKEDDTPLVRAGWVNALGYLPEGGEMFINQNAFTVMFTTLKAGKLSDYIDINKSAVHPEVYLSNHRQMAARLRFIPFTGQRNSPQLLSPVPNPVRGAEVTARYMLPKATTAQITFTDLNGRTVAEHAVAGDAGYHEVALPLNSMHSGMYMMQLITDGGVVSKLMELY
jgi:hypothetical protein